MHLLLALGCLTAIVAARDLANKRSAQLEVTRRIAHSSAINKKVASTEKFDISHREAIESGDDGADEGPFEEQPHYTWAKGDSSSLIFLSLALTASAFVVGAFFLNPLRHCVECAPPWGTMVTVDAIEDTRASAHAGSDAKMVMA